MRRRLPNKSEVPGAFDRVAATYDLLTGLNPGYHAHLRKSAARIPRGRALRLLDACCGTGSSTAALLAVHPDARIDAFDASEGMLEEARRKSWPTPVRFGLGDAMQPEASTVVEGDYDGIFIAYGIRNVPDPDACLAKLRALLRPGGTLVVHEYAVAHSRRTRLLWRLVARGIIIPGGRITAPSSPIYRYLERSVLEFDGAARFERRLADAGFASIEVEPMTGWQRGIVHGFVARRPETAEHDASTARRDARR